MTTDHKSRSTEPRRLEDRERCANCVFMWDAQDDKNAERKAEIQELNKKMECIQGCLTTIKAEVEDISEVKDATKHFISWRHFWPLVLLFLGFAVWVGKDHFDFKDQARNTMAVNTTLIKVLGENMSDLMLANGLKPKPMPEVKPK